MSKKIIVYDDYNSNIPKDQSVIGTVRQTFGVAALRNGFKIIETNMADKKTIELPSELKGKKFRIRKPTPRECFRLMGVSDADIDKIQAFPYESLIEHPAYSKDERFRGMTEKEKRAAMKRSISESAQYKLAGNSIVVDTLFHIFRKMFIEQENENQQLRLF